MILKITKLTRTTTKAKSGEIYEGLKVEGMKQVKDATPEKWDKFLYDWKDSEYIQILEQIGVGGSVNIKMTRNGRFWDIESMIPIKAADQTEGYPWHVLSGKSGGMVGVLDSPSSGQGTSASPATPPVTSPVQSAGPVASAVAPIPTATQVDVCGYTSQSIRTQSIETAKHIVIAMLANGEKFKKLLPPAVTTAALGEILIAYATRIEEYIAKGTEPDDTDPSGLDNTKDESGDPGPGDGDIPF